MSNTFISDCNCNVKGSLLQQCNRDGQCPCKSSNFGGTKCDQCAEGYTGFPSCEKKMKIKFHVIDAVLNKGIDKAKCKVTSGNEVAINDGLTDHAGFITTNKITPGNKVHVQVTIEGYDDMDLEFVADEDKDFKMIVMNPTVSIIFYYNELHISIFTNLDNNF